MERRKEKAISKQEHPRKTPHTATECPNTPNANVRTTNPRTHTDARKQTQ